MSKAFVSKEAHQDALLATLTPEDYQAYQSLKHTRAEPCYRGRMFVVYEMAQGRCVVRDQVEVLDFVCDDQDGASTELRSRTTGKRMKISYRPARLFDFPIYVWMPLCTRARWCADEDMAGKTGSLAFDLTIRVQSRRGLRDHGTVYFETAKAWSDEFVNSPVASA